MAAPPARPDGDSLCLTISYSHEGFALVAIENRGGWAVTLTMVGVWLPALKMGWDFGPSRVCKAHPYPGLPYLLDRGATVIFPINLADMYVKLAEKQTLARDFSYFASNDRAQDVYSAPVAVQPFLRALDDSPDGKPLLPGNESIFQA